MQDKMLIVQRAVEATLIPSGAKVTLQEGTPVTLTQALGNAYTLYISGNLVRVAGKDGDALGLVVLEEPDINQLQGSVQDKVWTQLKTCFDPEIPVNIADLGLIYANEVTTDDQGAHHVKIIMTLTAPGCGMGPVLVNEIEEKIRLIQEVATVKVDLVFDPPWNRDKMTEEAKLQLGLL